MSTKKCQNYINLFKNNDLAFRAKQFFKNLFRQHLFQNTYIVHVHVVQYNTLMYPAVPARANIAEIQDGAGPLQAICQFYLIPEICTCTLSKFKDQ
jgi:hypothetical protein